MSRNEKIEYLLATSSFGDKQVFKQMSDEALESAVILEKSRIDNQMLEAVSEI